MNTGLPPVLTQVALTVELSQRLVLFIVTGPDQRARPALEWIRSALPTTIETLWHRLDRESPDLAARVAEASSDRPLLLVHGLELMDDERRVETEARLNLLRDTLAPLRAIVVLWVPRSSVESFQRNCPDLLHWRSMLIEVSAADVPMDEDLAARLTYAAAMVRRLRALRIGPRLEGAPDIRLEEVYQEPDVRILDSRERVRSWIKAMKPADSATRKGAVLPLHDWIAGVGSALLIGLPGSGRSSALNTIALRMAGSVIEGRAESRLPILVHASTLEGLLHLKPAGVLKRLGRAVLPKDPSPPGRFERWARNGQLCVLVDGLDETEFRERILLRLEEFRSSFPKMPILVTGSDVTPRRPRWQVVGLLPFDDAQLERLIKQYSRATRAADALLPYLRFLLALPRHWELTSAWRTPLYCTYFADIYVYRGVAQVMVLVERLVREHVTNEEMPELLEDIFRAALEAGFRPEDLEGLARLAEERVGLARLARRLSRSNTLSAEARAALEATVALYAGNTGEQG